MLQLAINRSTSPSKGTQGSLSDIRGLIERSIDFYTSPSSLNSSITSFKELTPIVKSMEDVLFGFVIGRVVQESYTLIVSRYRKMPTEEQATKLTEIILRRAEEIREKIRLALMIR